MKILCMAQQWQSSWNIGQAMNSQNTPHSSPSQMSYGVSVVSISQKMIYDIMGP